MFVFFHTADAWRGTKGKKKTIKLKPVYQIYSKGVA
jgi:hypothetical protein